MRVTILTDLSKLRKAVEYAVDFVLMESEIDLYNTKKGIIYPSPRTYLFYASKAAKLKSVEIEFLPVGETVEEKIPFIVFEGRAKHTLKTLKGLISGLEVVKL